VYDARADDYRWRTIIGGIVKSDPFLKRTAPAAPTSVARAGGKAASSLQ
jgi:hypothetical protein